MSEDSYNSSIRRNSFGEDNAPSLRRPREDKPASKKASPELKELRRDVEKLRKEAANQDAERREIDRLKEEKRQLQRKLGRNREK